MALTDGSLGPPRNGPRRIHRVGHVALEVQDLERALDFYVRACNLVPVGKQPGAAMLRSRFEHHCLVLEETGRSALGHIGFETLDDARTAELRADLAARNVPIREAPGEPGRTGLAFQFQDPEGTWVEVYRAMERLPGIVSGGPFQLEKLGHLTMLARDLEAQASFYRSVGLRISDRWPRGVFLRCGTDHHGLAFLPSPRSSLHHHAYGVGDWEQIKFVLDWMCRCGVAPEAGPVRHGPGNNIAVYCRDPDGFRVEFYCEMEQILDDEDHAREYVRAFNLWLRASSPAGFHD